MPRHQRSHMEDIPWGRRVRRLTCLIYTWHSLKSANFKVIKDDRVVSDVSKCTCGLRKADNAVRG